MLRSITNSTLRSLPSLTTSTPLLNAIPIISNQSTSILSSPTLRSLANNEVKKLNPISYGGPSKGYRSPLQAAILDWSGTCADIYVIAPAVAFVEVFKMKGVDISMNEARIPMGLRKDLHIKALTEIPAIRARWAKVHGREPNQKDVDDMFKDFIPAQMKCLPNYTKLIPGTAEAVLRLKKEFGLKIGNTTGFQRIMVDVLLAEAKKQGYHPDTTVAGDDVEYPRPYPFMVFENLKKLGIMPVHSVVKVDDTIGGIGEGLNAGCWTVGLYETSNYMQIDSLEHAASLSASEMAARALASKKKLEGSGAHYVIPDIRGLPEVIKDINKRLMNGERP